MKRRWPWDEVAKWAATDKQAIAVAPFSVETTFDGWPITVGPVAWSGGAVGGLSRLDSGSGLFVIVKLTRAYPAMAVWPRPLLDGRPLSDEFADRFSIVADGIPDAYANAALQNAHLDGRVPPWVLVGDELLAIREGIGWLAASTVVPEIAAGLIRVAELLGAAPHDHVVTEADHDADR